MANSSSLVRTLIAPGATLFIRIPYEETSRAKASAIRFSAALIPQ